MRQFAKIMAGITLVGTAAVVLIGPAMWLIFFDRVVAGMGPPFAADDFSSTQRLLGALVALIGGAIRAYGLLGLRHTFVQAARGAPLSARSVRGFRRFARVEAVMVLVGIAQNAAFGAIATSASPELERALPIQIGSPEIGALFIALLLMFAAEMMAEGQRAADENAAFL